MVDYRTENLIRAKAAEEDALESQVETEFKRDNFLLDQLFSSHHAYAGSKLIKSCIVNDQVEGQLLTNLFTNPSFETPDGTATLYQNLFSNPRFKTPGGTQEVYRNLFENPSFETADGTVELWRNLFTNPSFKTPGGAVEVRRNYCPNPRLALSGTPGWNVAGPSAPANVTLTRSTSEYHAFDSSLRVELGTPTVTDGAYIYKSVTVPVGTVQSASAWVKAPAGTSLYLFMRITDGTTADKNVDFTATGDWQRISGTMDQPSTTQGTNLMVGIRLRSATGVTAPLVYYVTELVQEMSPAPAPYYFDGSYSPDPDLTPSWAGTANASESVLNGERVKGVGSSQAETLVYKSGVGAKSVKASSGGSQYQVNFADLSLTSGSIYTVVFRARSTQDGEPLGVRITSGAILAQVELTQEFTDYSLTFTADVSAPFTLRRLAPEVGAALEIEHLLLVAGAYSGGYFDGDAPEKIGRNLHPNPAAASGLGYFTGWGGSGGNVASLGYSTESDWTERGTAYYIAWSEVLNPDSGDIGVGVGSQCAPGVVYTLEYDIKLPRAGVNLNAPGSYSNGSGTTEIIDRSPSLVSTKSDQVVHCWVTFYTDAVAAPNLRFPNSLKGIQSGDRFEISNARMYLGAKDANYSYFDGNSGLGYAWEGSPNVSRSYQYDGDQTAQWAGAAHDSQSYVTAVKLKRIQINRASDSTAWHAKTVDGVKFVRPASDVNGSYRLGLFQTPNIASAGILAGEKITVLVEITSPVAYTHGVRFASASGVGPFDQVNVSVESGRRWYRVVFTASENVTQTTIGFYYPLQSSSLIGAGPTIFHNILVIEGAYSGDYFDGAASPDVDLIASWTGAANDSESVLSGSYPKGISQSQNGHRGVVSASGGMRALSLNSSTQQYDFVSLTGFGFVPGDTYTLIADLTLEGHAEYAQGVIGAYVRYWGAASPSLSAITPLVEGERVRVEIRETIPLDTTGSVVFRIQGTQGTSVRVENLLIAKGDYRGGYFDGDAPEKILSNLIHEPIPQPGSSRYTSGSSVFEIGGVKLAGKQNAVPAGYEACSYRMHVIVGRTYTVSFVAIGDKTVPNAAWSLRLGTNSGLSPHVDSVSIDITLQPKRFSHTFVATQEVMYIGIKNSTSTSPTVATTWGIGRVLLTLEDNTHEWFDPNAIDAAWEGEVNASPSYKYDQDFASRWIGAEQDSASVIEGQAVKNASTNVLNGKVIKSKDGARYIPQGGSSASAFIHVAGSSSGLAGNGVSFEPGKTYTAVGLIYLPEPQSGSLGSNARSWQISTNEGIAHGASAPNAAGFHEIRHTFTIGIAATYARLALNSTEFVGSVGIRLVKAVLVEGEYTGDYFDGDITSLPVERENMALRPTGASEVNAGLEGGGSGSSAIVETPSMLFSSKVYEFTHISGSRGISITSAAGVGGGQLATGETFTISFSVWVKEGGASPDFVIRNQNWQNSGLVVTASSGASMWNHAVSKRGEWVRVYFTFNSTSATSIKCYSATNDSADYYIDGILIQRGGLEEYFDGDSPNSYWTGEPNDSPSARYPARYNTPRWLGAEHDSKSQMWARAYDVPQPSSMLVHNNPDGTIYLSGPGVHDDGEGTISISDDNVTVHPGGVLEF